jgi:hypothetical protein
MGLLIFTTFRALYFLPTIIGFRKRDVGAIFILNLLLGWTVIGWVVCLVWVLTTEDAPAPNVGYATIQPPPPTCPACHAPVIVSDVFCTR